MGRFQAPRNTCFRKVNYSTNLLSDHFSLYNYTYIDELQQLQADMAAKDARAQEIANAYIEEARTLLASLSDDFDGQKFSGRQLATLNNQFNQAVTQFNNGHYESAIASAKDVAINTLEEIYEADAQKQEWENYFKLALVLSEEVKTYIGSQSVITEDAKAYAEEAWNSILCPKYLLSIGYLTG